MAERAYQVPENGAEVRIADINSISDNAGYADDRVLQELFRFTVGSATPDRAILPYGKRGWAAESGLTSTAMIHGNVSDGSVRVMPFRAIIGSTETSDMLGQLRDIRSGYKVGVIAQQTVVPISANSSGDDRWDLVYAIVTPDQDADSDTYVRKNVTSLVVSVAPTTVIAKKTGVTLSVVTGVPAGTPTRPALPGDGGGAYNIALAYIYVPDGHTTSSAIDRATIHEVAPCYPIHSSTGAASLVPANHQHKIGGTIDTNQDGAISVSRPAAYLPSTMVGKEEVIATLELGTTPPSHTDEDIVDDSRDWRFRYFKWTAMYTADAASNNKLASDRSASAVPAKYTGSAGFTLQVQGSGQSFLDDSNNGGELTPTITIADSHGAVVELNNDVAPLLVSADERIVVYVNNDGAMVIRLSGAPVGRLILWIEATGPYSNFGTV